MKKTLFALASAIAFVNSAKAIELSCVSPKVLKGDAANNPNNPLVNIVVRHNGDKWWVRYNFSNGSHVDRADQYDGADVGGVDLAKLRSQNSYILAKWIGIHKRRKNILVQGAIYEVPGEGYAYGEWITDIRIKEQTFSMVAPCQIIGGGAPVMTHSPPPAAAPTPQTAPIPSTQADIVPMYTINGRQAQVDVILGSSQPVRMTIDTGAETGSVTEDIANILIRRGDAVEEATRNFRLADGSVSTSRMIKVFRLSLGDRFLNNVDLSIVPNGTTMLLDFPTLNQFGRFTLDMQRGQIVFN